MVQIGWQAEIERVAAGLEQTDPGGFPALARALHHSLCSAPPEVGAALGTPCSRSRLDTLLENGANREVAFELLGRVPYAISRTVDERVQATVISEIFPETDFVSGHESIAFAGALASGLRDWARALVLRSGSRVTH